MKKKASLELTMYAIAISILAIVVIALGMVLIRNIFGGITIKAQEAVSTYELVNPPTTDTPLTAAPSSLTIKQGDSGKAVIAFLNNLYDNYNCKLNHGITTNAISPPDILYSRQCMPMKEGQINTWTVAISAPIDATPALTTFTMKMSCYDKSDATCSGAVASISTRDVVVGVKI